MEWKVTNQYLISSSDGSEFVVGLNWKPPFTESSKLRRKLAFSRMIGKEEQKHACTLEIPQTATAQLAVADASLDGKVSLGALVASVGARNSTIFMRISQEQYWVLSLTANNAIELSSDKVLNYFGVRDYIEERVALQGDADHRIINIGEATSFDASTFEDQIEHIDLKEFTKKTNKGSASIHELSSTLATRMLFGAYATVGALAGAGYMYATYETDEYISLKNGDHSIAFISTVTSLNQQYKKVINSQKRKTMSTEDFIKEGRSQYNNYVLNRKYSNNEILKHLQNIDASMPLNFKGWNFQGVEYERQTFEIRYSRMYGAGVALNFKDFSEALTKHIGKQHGVSVSLSRIEEQGDIAVLEVAPIVKENKALLSFLENSREVIDKRNVIANKIREELKALGFSTSEISDIENSITLLNMFQKKDTELLNRIIEKISFVATKEQGRIRNVKKLLKEYKMIEDVEIPTHEETILQEGGIQDTIFPLLQDTTEIIWGEAQLGEGYPVGVNSQVFKGKKILNELLIELEFERPLHHAAIMEDIFSLDSVHVSKISYQREAGSTTLKITISIVEANEAFIKVEKKLN